jgi:hypothetical protein
MIEWNGLTTVPAQLPFTIFQMTSPGDLFRVSLSLDDNIEESVFEHLDGKSA